MKYPLHHHVKPVALLLSLMSVSVIASDTDRKSGLDAHEHGAAQILVAKEGSLLVVEFESPAFNMLGFEHLPSTDEQKAERDRVLSVLSDWQKVISLPAASACKNVATDIEWTADDHGDSHEHEHDEHTDGDGHDHDEHKDDDGHDHDEHKDDDGHDHEEHDHEGESETHSEFHIVYEFNCAGPVEQVTLKAFDEFPLLETVSGAFIHESGQGGATLEAASSTLEL